MQEMIRLMEENLHHLLSMKPYLKLLILHTNWLAGFLPTLYLEFQTLNLANPPQIFQVDHRFF